ncbi:hypothetical protein HYQ44_000203 [Verticillium longisporum]|nr:hypothetical protein HYQ44_000203 [Verticillium longisporum]
MLWTTVLRGNFEQSTTYFLHSLRVAITSRVQCNIRPFRHQRRQSSGPKVESHRPSLCFSSSSSSSSFCIHIAHSSRSSPSSPWHPSIPFRGM